MKGKLLPDRPGAAARRGEERETLLGYAVLKLTAGGDTGYVLDLMTRPGRDDAARALLKGAIEHFE